MISSRAQLELDLMGVCNKAISEKVPVGDIYATLCKVRQIHINLFNYEVYNTAQKALAIKQKKQEQKDDTKEG